MDKKQILILDQERIDWKLQRMAYQIWEHNSNETTITLAGIAGNGLAVAESLAERLRKISQLQVNVISIKINKKQPREDNIHMDTDLNGSSVVLVDDVANSGKTLLYALRPLLMFDLKKIMIAVLVDRKHKSFPVYTDIVGHSVATTLQEHIEVETEDGHVKAAYLK